MSDFRLLLIAEINYVFTTNRRERRERREREKVSSVTFQELHVDFFYVTDLPLASTQSVVCVAQKVFIRCL
jgi:hypothetical protein